MFRGSRSNPFRAVSAFSRASSLALALAAFALPGSLWGEPCRQKLVLGLDVSGSVDSGEYRLQLEGLAQALTDPAVRAALLAPGPPVAVHVFEWSGPQYQSILRDWTLITDAATLEDIARDIAATRRSPAPPSTALGTAIAFAAQTAASGPDCWASTIDISGDGKSNTGPRPQDIGTLPGEPAPTVNALVINTIDSMGAGPGTEDLVSYFENLVIRGPGAFVEVAEGFEDYARAMRKKLLRELNAFAIGALDPTDPRVAADQ